MLSFPSNGKFWRKNEKQCLPSFNKTDNCRSLKPCQKQKDKSVSPKSRCQSELCIICLLNLHATMFFNKIALWKQCFDSTENKFVVFDDSFFSLPSPSHLLSFLSTNWSCAVDSPSPGPLSLFSFLKLNCQRR